MLRINLTSVFVDDQDKALAFYTGVLGFVKRQDIPAGPFNFLTVAAAGDSNGVELLLEPNDNPLSATFQKGIYESGIPATSFGVDDIHAEHERLKGLGVVFAMEPTDMGPATVATFDDTCGNLIGLHQVG